MMLFSIIFFQFVFMLSYSLSFLFLFFFGSALLAQWAYDLGSGYLILCVVSGKINNCMTGIIFLGLIRIGTSPDFPDPGAKNEILKSYNTL